MKRIIPLILLTCLAFTSCKKNNVLYSQFQSIPSANWHMDSIAHFDYTIADTSITYAMRIYIRHNDRYPYQNIWLYAGDEQRDSINIYLADDRGKWYGDTHNGFIEVPINFGEHLHFRDTGTYHLAIQHGMRDEYLSGVTDVGMELIAE